VRLSATITTQLRPDAKTALRARRIAVDFEQALVDGGKGVELSFSADAAKTLRALVGANEWGGAHYPPGSAPGETAFQYFFVYALCLRIPFLRLLTNGLSRIARKQHNRSPANDIGAHRDARDTRQLDDN